MENKRKIRLGISTGDLNGIGVEILLKTFKDSRMFEFCTPVVYASQKVINFLNMVICCLYKENTHNTHKTRAHGIFQQRDDCKTESY